MAVPGPSNLARAAQILMARRTVVQKEMEEYAREYGDGNAENFANVMRERLKPFLMAVERVRSEATGEIVYGVISTRSDDIAKIGSQYNPLQLAFFNRIIDKILSKSGEIDPNDILRDLRLSLDAPPPGDESQAPQAGPSTSQAPAASSSKSAQLLPNEAERTLDRFIQDGWLVRYRRGGQRRVTLGDRGRMEFTEAIQAAVDRGDLPPCLLCKQPAFRFLEVPAPSRGPLPEPPQCPKCCEERVHEGCLAREPPGRAVKCSCGDDWPRPDLGEGGGSGAGAAAEEGAAGDSEEQQATPPASASVSAPAKRPRRA